jgi:hypothetical protein
MGRSVDYLSYAVGVTFIPLEYNSEDEGDQDWVWEDFEETVKDACTKIAPSLYEVSKKWDRRETRIILANRHCEIGISLYMTLASVSIRHNQSDYSSRESLAVHWINQVWPKMVEEIGKYYTILRKLGSMSNGEGVYEEVKPKPVIVLKG